MKKILIVAKDEIIRKALGLVCEGMKFKSIILQTEETTCCVCGWHIFAGEHYILIEDRAFCCEACALDDEEFDS